MKDWIIDILFVAGIIAYACCAIMIIILTIYVGIILF